jgi:hypothetical protein
MGRRFYERVKTWTENRLMPFLKIIAASHDVAASPKDDEKKMPTDYTDYTDFFVFL